MKQLISTLVRGSGIVAVHMTEAFALPMVTQALVTYLRISDFE